MHECFMLNKACGLGLYKINSKGNLNFEMAYLKLKKTIKSREKKITKSKSKDCGWARAVCEILKIKGDF